MGKSAPIDLIVYFPKTAKAKEHTSRSKAAQLMTYDA